MLRRERSLVYPDAGAPSSAASAGRGPGYMYQFRCPAAEQAQPEHLGGGAMTAHRVRAGRRERCGHLEQMTGGQVPG
jgi:hypothetical protein